MTGKKKGRIGSSFDNQQWYEGQELLVQYETLKQAEWLPPPATKPSDRIRRGIAKASHSRLLLTIEKVRVLGLDLDWVCYTLGGGEDSQDRPPRQLKEDELSKVSRLDWFEYQTAQIGDRVKGGSSVIAVLPGDPT